MTTIDLHSEYLRAELFLTSGQPTEAVAILAPVVAEYPDGWARRALARTLERQHRADEAATHHRMADALGAAS
jgi:hypothetical protein